jgi:uncharacterized protein YjiS (DUF1127 family)
MTMLTESRPFDRPHIPTGLLAAIVDRVGAYRRNRRALRDLTEMDDHMLLDIGLSRADIVRASIAEFGVDRMAMLDHARARRVG